MQRLWAAFIAAVVAATIGLAGLGAVQPPRASAADPCAAPVTNVVACENTKPGNPKSEWDVSGAGSTSIQGFATDISVNHGDRARFKIKTTAKSYRLDIYRMGYYGGNGARKVATISLASNPSPSQPTCLTNSSTGLIDCGNWSESTSWLVPADAVSGIYFARLVRTDNTSGSSHVMFIVRDDASHSDLFFQTSDTTWQAYNSYGGNSLYTGSPAGRAYKVSYNRPFNTRGGSTEDWVFNSEYPMVRFLEANGYDVSYTTGVDSDRRGDLIKNHKAFLSVGHDEYWSGGQRAKVEAARDAGVNLAFFSGNEMFWKTRWENSIDSSGTAHRTLVCYKETHANAKIDPSTQWTGTWRDPRFSPPADGGRPENALIGQQFRVNSGTRSVQVSANEGRLRLWRGTRAATLASGGSTTIGTDTVGYEWDTDVDNGVRPKGVIDLSTTNATGVDVLLDNGSTFGTGDAVHHLTLYRADSGALVFGAGSVQWSWGLDSSHDRGSAAADTAAKQATVNMFADMGVQPSTLQSGLTTASASTDTTAPTSTITSPIGSVAASSTVTISGTASDTGGVVAGVEVSTDGGTTWHPATGTTSWSYRWRTPSSGSATIKTRATDDSGRTEAPAPGVQVTVGGPPPQVDCPCSLWSATDQPISPSDTDTTGTEVGVKFRADRDGTITGLRFYKGTSNTGTHVGHLWSRTGTQLASVNYTNESASGWQQANFSSPVPVTANTTYVASYYAPNGRYAEDDGYFATAGYGSSPLYALADGEDGANSVYRTGSGFPTGTYQSANYWVDVVFSTGSTTPETDTTPPSVTSRTPASGATGVSVGTTVTATFSEPIQAETAAVSVKDTGGGAVAGTTAYDSSTRTVRFTPSAALAASTAYNVTVSGAKDAAGNVMAANTWSFTTGAVAPSGTYSVWSSTDTPATPTDGDTAAVEVGMKFRADVTGKITGIRFYKGTGNSGTHVGHLWSSSGQQLGSVTFSGETATGWQQATFATPITVTSGTTYVASYYAPSGRYAADEGFFTASGVDSGPLHALRNGVDGSNGVYRYGTGGGFPASSYNATNYWVDVVFTTGS